MRPQVTRDHHWVWIRLNTFALHRDSFVIVNRIALISVNRSGKISKRCDFPSHRTCVKRYSSRQYPQVSIQQSTDESLILECQIEEIISNNNSMSTWKLDCNWWITAPWIQTTPPTTIRWFGLQNPYESITIGPCIWSDPKSIACCSEKMRVIVARPWRGCNQEAAVKTDSCFIKRPEIQHCVIQIWEIKFICPKAIRDPIKWFAKMFQFNLVMVPLFLKTNEGFCFQTLNFSP
jgi:hypothetical protein